MKVCKMVQWKRGGSLSVQAKRVKSVGKKERDGMRKRILPVWDNALVYMRLAFERIF